MPCQDQIDALTALDFYKAGTHHAFAFPQDEQSVTLDPSAFLAESRNRLVKDLLERGCDYIIFIDSDMRFPQTLYNDLMLHDLPVVAANCSKRRRPVSATARKEAENDPSQLVPVWPDSRYAETFIGGDWADAQVTGITLRDWVERRVPGMIKQGTRIAVFPVTATAEGAVVTEPERLQWDLQRAAEQYE